MGQNRTPRRDVTHRFTESSPQQPASEEGTEPNIPSDGNVGSVPVFDPLGLLEELCDGRVPDPVRHGIVRFLVEVLRYRDSSGNRP